MATSAKRRLKRHNGLSKKEEIRLNQKKERASVGSVIAKIGIMVALAVMIISLTATIVALSNVS